MSHPSSDPIVAAFERLAASDPERPLVVSAGRLASRGEVARLSRAIEQRHFHGGLAGPVVALVTANGPAFLAGFLAIKRAGRTVLLLDWKMPESARLRAAAATGATSFLVAAEAWPLSSGAFELSPIDEGDRAPEDAVQAKVIKLTSGSTGAPRGIVTPSSALIADDQALAAAMGLTDDERILAAIPMSHSYGLSSVVLPALMRGSVVAVPEAGGPFAALEVAASAKVTFVPTVPAYLSAVLSVASPPPLPESVRLVTSAGAPLEPRVASAFRLRYGLAVHAFYGASECGGICYDRVGSAGERGTVGTPIGGVDIELGERFCGSSGPGRVVVRSPAVAAGYHPPAPGLGGGRFTTGDLAEWRDGELALVGRVDDLINVKGRKVNPRAVESILLQLPGVLDAAVFGTRPADDVGEAVNAVVACDRERVDRGGLRAFCREHLAEYQIPRCIELVDELPRTTRGKLDFRALEQLFGSRSPESVG